MIEFAFTGPIVRWDVFGVASTRSRGPMRIAEPVEGGTESTESLGFLDHLTGSRAALVRAQEEVAALAQETDPADYAALDDLLRQRIAEESAQETDLPCPTCGRNDSARYNPDLAVGARLNTDCPDSFHTVQPTQETDPE